MNIKSLLTGPLFIFLSVSEPIAAQVKLSFSRLAILGNHLGDPRAAVDHRLLTLGYEETGDAYPRCDRTLSATIRDLARAKQSTVPHSALNCTEIYSKGTNRVTAQYLLGQHGYVLEGMIYDSTSSELPTKSLAYYYRVFGKPDFTEEGLYRWYSTRVKGAPYFQYGRTGKLASVYITGSTSMSRTFYDEAGQLLRRAVTQ